VSGLAATIARRRRTSGRRRASSRRRGSGRRRVSRRRRVSPRRAAARALRRLSPRVKRRLLALAVLCLALAAGYQLWLRDSSLVAVEEVTVTGLTTKDADRLRAALTTAGRTMTTLHLDRAALERAVAGHPVVRDLEVAADFPHGLRVHVVEHQPAAIAVSDAGRLPVAGDGTILRGLAVEGDLPTVDVDGRLGGVRLADRTARGAAAVAGAAPAALRSRIEEVSHGSSHEGFVAALRDGPELIFGGATRLRAKWAAAARVLADLEARGASYVDLRIPGRPAVGGLAATTLTPVAPAGTETAPPATALTDPAAGASAGAPSAGAPSTVVPGAAPSAPSAPTTTAPTAPTTTAPEAPVAPEQPLTAGAGGGATAAP
jgi:cell division protein FtsQ